MFHEPMSWLDALPASKMLFRAVTFAVSRLHGCRRARYLLKVGCCCVGGMGGIVETLLLVCAAGAAAELLRQHLVLLRLLLAASLAGLVAVPLSGSGLARPSRCRPSRSRPGARTVVLTASSSSWDWSSISEAKEGGIRPKRAMPVPSAFVPLQGPPPRAQAWFCGAGALTARQRWFDAFNYWYFCQEVSRSCCRSPTTGRSDRAARDPARV